MRLAMTSVVGGISLATALDHSHRIWARSVDHVDDATGHPGDTPDNFLNLHKRHPNAFDILTEGEKAHQPNDPTRPGGRIIKRTIDRRTLSGHRLVRRVQKDIPLRAVPGASGGGHHMPPQPAIVPDDNIKQVPEGTGESTHTQPIPPQSESLEQNGNPPQNTNDNGPHNPNHDESEGNDINNRLNANQKEKITKDDQIAKDDEGKKDDKDNKDSKGKKDDKDKEDKKKLSFWKKLFEGDQKAKSWLKVVMIVSVMFLLVMVIVSFIGSNDNPATNQSVFGKRGLDLPGTTSYVPLVEKRQELPNFNNGNQGISSGDAASLSHPAESRRLLET